MVNLAKRKMKLNKNTIIKDLLTFLGFFTFGAGLLIYLLGIEFKPEVFVRNVPLFIMFIGFCLLLYGLFGGVGGENAKELEAVKTSKESYDDTRKKIPMNHMDDLDKYCRVWTKKDIESKRYGILAGASLPYENFDPSIYTKWKLIKLWMRSFLSATGEQKFRRDQIRALRKAVKVKPQILTAGMLLTCEEDDDLIDMTHPKVKRRKQAVKDFVPILFSALIGVGIGDVVLNGFTAEKIMTFLFVAYMFAVASVKGYISGYKEISVHLVGYREKQVMRMEEYLASDFCPCKDHETKQISD